MKLMVVCHTYMVDEARGKFVELLKLLPDLKISIICPKSWPYTLYTLYPEPCNCPGIEILQFSTLFKGREGAYIFFPYLTAALGKIKPDILQVEQGPSSLVYFMLLNFKKFLAPAAKTIFFTWTNWWYSYPPPRSWIERYNLRNSNYAIVGNQDAGNIIQKKGYAGPIKILAQWGIDPDLYKKKDVETLRDELQLESSCVIGFVGRLIQEKGILTLVQSLKNIKQHNWKLLLVGDGNLKPSIQLEVQKAGIDNRVIYAGSVKVRDVPEYINCMDILVLPSISTPLWKEQFGHVLIEAMACEVPVVASTCGEIPNVVADAGFIFPEGDADQLSKYLNKLILDQELRRKLGNLGRKRVLQKYTHRAIAQELKKIYTELINNK